MIVYKGMRGNMTCTMGKGIYQYEVGKTYREEQSKAANTGFHSVENPLYVLHWYGTGDSRYFMCEAGGSIDEAKEDNKIASTELTILKELTIKELAGHGMMWMVNHPSRAWEHDICCCQVRKDQAEMKLKGGVAIARGENPRVRGVAGAVLGLIREEDGVITGARLLEVTGGVRPWTWYVLDGDTPREEKETGKHEEEIGHAAEANMAEGSELEKPDHSPEGRRYPDPGLVKKRKMEGASLPELHIRRV